MRWRPGWSSAYARFDEGARASFIEARRLYDDGHRLAAREALQSLQVEDPDNLEVGAWLQDVESELLEGGLDLFAGRHSLSVETPEDVLRLVYAEDKDRSPTVSSLILAARAETDVIAAENLLDKALELDPTCAWAHYARSHILLLDRTRIDRWGLARAALDRALELNPGHLRARRLESWMLSQEGSSDAAEKSLGRWLDVALEDPRVHRREEVGALLDLALLFLLGGDDGRAERILDDLEGEEIERSRRLALLAVARQEGGDSLGALEATLRAQGAGRGEVLPLVQEAMIQELFLGDSETAEERWRAVAELADESTEIADLVRGLRARVRIERVEEERRLREALEAAETGRTATGADLP